MTSPILQLIILMLSMLLGLFISMSITIYSLTVEEILSVSDAFHMLLPIIIFFYFPMYVVCYLGAFLLLKYIAPYILAPYSIKIFTVSVLLSSLVFIISTVLFEYFVQLLITEGAVQIYAFIAFMFPSESYTSNYEYWAVLAGFPMSLVVLIGCVTYGLLSKFHNKFIKLMATA